MGFLDRFFKPKQSVKAVPIFIRAGNRYEALKNDPDRPRRERRTDATRTEQWFSGEKRIRSYDLADDLYDNEDVGATLDSCIRLTIGVNGGSVWFTGMDKEKYQEQFNAWKKVAGFTENENFSDLLALILRTVKLHGDCVILCDPDLTGGKVRIWDADQICSVNDSEFRRWCDENGYADCRQVEGVVLDADERVLGWWVTMLRNRYSVDMKDAMFLPSTLARRVSYRKLVSQIRGESALLANCDITSDTGALLKSEVQASRNTAEIAVAIIKPAAASNNALAAMTQGISPEKLTENTGFTPEEIASMTAAAKQDNTFEAYSGKSALAYFDNGTQIQRLNNDNRPSTSIMEWTNNLADRNGRRLGVMSSLARNRADHSYSAGQIELEISWKQMEEDQKLLERQVVDYVVGTLYPNATYVCNWPAQFEIDPQKGEAVKDAKIRGGRDTLMRQLGPNWQEILLQQQAEMEFVKAHDLTTTPYLQPQAGTAMAKEQRDAGEDENGDKN
ncbi:MAG: phage portal protein [Victivallales bacterium]|nr:phage portal protein [Victivallales bacterium]